MNAEPGFIKYQDLKSMTVVEEVKSTKEIEAEDKAHREFIAGMGPKRIIYDEAEEDVTPVDKKTNDANKVAPASYLHEMSHEQDPKQVLLDKIGNLDCLRLSGAQILVATYVRPERKKSGIILTSNVREEDKFQGKCGLVLKRGPLAFKATEKLDFGGYESKVGDWVWYRPMDGYALSVNGVHCRVLDDVEIKGDIDHPDVVV